MKRTILVLLAIIIVMTFVAPVFAGSFLDNLQAGVADKALGAIITAIFFVVSSVFGVKKILRFRKTALEAKDVLVEIYKATRDDSPGGSSITGKEFDKILNATGELGTAAIAAIANK